MLWSIVGTSHKILGSVHILPTDAVLPDWATSSYDGIEKLVFEADHRSPLIQKMETGINRTGGHLECPGVSQVYLRASKLLNSHGINVPFDAFLPWRAAFFVITHLLPTYGLSHDHGMDNKLRTIVDNNGLEIDFLETPTRAFDLIDSSCKRSHSGIDFFEHVVSYAESGSGLLELQRIIKDWLTVDLDDFTSLHNEKLAQFPFIFDALITQRNKEWVPIARDMILGSKPTLFVVGVLHTVGTGSFIDNLENIGFHCEPQFPFK